MAGSVSPRRQAGFGTELVILVALLLTATVIRFRTPDSVPPGPSHDELRMIELGEFIVEGQRPIHWRVSYSAEPLFMYLVALASSVFGFTPFAARLVTRFAGLLLVPLVHATTRHLFGRRTGIVASAIMALTWWPLFFSRVALRGITLPLLFILAVYLIWRGIDLRTTERDRRPRTVRWRWLAVGGGVLGLTWYTFTAARGLAALIPLFLVYLGLMRAIPVRSLWRIAAVTLGLAALIAAPFVYDIEVNPGAPEARMDQLSGVIDEMREGNLVLFARQALATMGMLLLRGDPNWRYNVSNRPALDPVLGSLAVLGFAVCLIRWKRPQYFVLLLWLLLGLAPSMLTPEAPSYVRAIGALPPAMMLPGIGAVYLWDGAGKLTGRKGARMVSVLLFLLLATSGVLTYYDYFAMWPLQPPVREIYQATLSEALRDLGAADLKGEIWISEPFPDDRHLMLAQRTIRDNDVELRWFDAGRALMLPPLAGSRHYLLADFSEPDQVLFDRWITKSPVILEGKGASQSGEPTYRIYKVEGGPWVDELMASAIQEPGGVAYADLAAENPVHLPARFGEAATLLSYELADSQLASGEEVHLIVYWRALGPVYEPLVSFAHLLDGQSRVVGQYDGFDVPPHYWKPGSVIAQVYRFPVGAHAQPGLHWLEVGMYNPQSMERLLVFDTEGDFLGDRLLLREVAVLE